MKSTSLDVLVELVDSNLIDLRKRYKKAVGCEAPHLWTIGELVKAILVEEFWVTELIGEDDYEHNDPDEICSDDFDEEP